MKLRELISRYRKNHFRPISNLVDVIAGDKFLWMGNPIEVFDIVNFPSIEITLPDGNKITVLCGEVLFRNNGR